MASRRFDAEPVVAEIELIEIRFEDLVLGVMTLHLSRRGLLPQLAPETSCASLDDAGVHVADELLRDGARAAPLAEDVVFHRAEHADDVDAVVLIEALILDGDECLRDVLRQRLERDGRAPLATHLANE